MGTIAQRDAILREKLQAMTDQELEQYKKNALRFVKEHSEEEITESMRAVITAIQIESDKRSRIANILEQVPEYEIIAEPDVEIVSVPKQTRSAYSPSTRKQPKQKKKWSLKKKVVVGVCALSGLSLFAPKEAEETPEIQEDPPAYVEQVEKPVPSDKISYESDFEETSNDQPEFSEDQTELDSNVKEPETLTPEAPTEPQDGQNVAGEEIVYITNSGQKYHKAFCRHLENSKIEVTKAEAEAQGKTPCKVCH